MNQLVTPAAAEAAAVTTVQFTGERRDFRRLVTRGAFLELITLGFYRFWLATDIRRYLWSNTSVGGDAPEYVGTAKELLIGFLFAMAIMVPVYLIYFLAGLEAERLQAFASIPLVLFFYFFAQFAAYRARRYRITRTIWRGVRFGMGGSGWRYAWRAGLWSLLTIVTLGLAYPWQQAALERFKMKHTFYGNLEGRFEATGGSLFKQGWGLWLLAILTGWLIIPLPFIYAAFKAMEWRWWVSGVRFGDVRFQSTLPKSALMGLYWKVIGWGALLFAGLSAWFGLVFAGTLAISGIGSDGQASLTPEQVGALMEQPGVWAALILGYIAAALIGATLVRMKLVHDVWARVASSTIVHNLALAGDVIGQGRQVDALGEGFADSLDIGGF